MRQDTLALKRFWFWQASTTLQGGVHGGRVLNAVWGCLVTPCGTTTASGMSLHGEGLPRTAPNTMNRFGIIMSELGFCDLGLYNFEGQMQESYCTYMLHQFSNRCCCCCCCCCGCGCGCGCRGGGGGGALCGLRFLKKELMTKFGQVRWTFTGSSRLWLCQCGGCSLAACLLRNSGLLPCLHRAVWFNSGWWQRIGFALWQCGGDLEYKHWWHMGWW